MMRDVRSLLSMEKIYKNAVIKAIPELEGFEFESGFQTGLVCPQCGRSGREGGSALFYRLLEKDSWEQVGETFKCSICRDLEDYKHYLSNSLNDQRQDISERIMKDYFLLPTRLKDSGFKNYHETDPVTTSAKQKAISYTKTFLSCQQERYNLLIQGNPGTGKTHLCTAIARTLSKEGFLVGFLTAGQLLSKIKATYNKSSLVTEEMFLKDIKKLDLLILDDLGAEAKGGSDDWRKGMIFEVVESRSGKPTIYTSNLTDIELPAAVGERVFSRLYDHTRVIDLFTEDYRKRLQIK